jgi:hypothetical protein
VSLSEWRRLHGGTCEACGADLTHDTAECSTLCAYCCDRIDRDYELLRDLAELEAGP